MVATLEAILEQVKTLSDSERAKLVEALKSSNRSRNGTLKDRHDKIRAFRGKYRGILPGIDEFMAEKRSEIEREEQRWRP